MHIVQHLHEFVAAYGYFAVMILVGLESAGVPLPGETALVTLTVPARVFARYDEQAARWIWPSGEFTVAVGRSSRDLRLHTAVTVT